MNDTPELFVTAKRGFTTISPDRETVVSFDREGRLYAYFKAGSTYRRSLASVVEARHREGSRQRRRLSPDEAREIFAEAYAVAAACYDQAPPEVQQRLRDEILPWTPERLLSQGEEFRRIYAPITILPPDQYLSIVLQATEGCTWNRCTFCSFYQGRPFRAKSEEEFADHARAVQAFFGKGAWMRKGIFFADGNALALSKNRLEPLFRLAGETFPGEPIYSFIDLYTGERKRVGDWRRLRELGLARVYIGMETGDDELLAFLNKPGSQEELVRFVHDLKEAGVAVGLIVMVGVGGQEHRDVHAEKTLKAISRMPLADGDLVYLSPFIEHPGSEYARRRDDAGLTPMTEAEIEAELRRLAKEIRGMGMKAARYDIREFIY